MSGGARYVPAAGRAWLTRAYDPMLALTMRESRWRSVVVREALAAGGAAVDVGAGTGAQSLALAEAGTRVIAVDGDPQALAIAQRKGRAETVEWRVGLADSLPVESGSVDAVVMALLLHHLDGEGKRAALREAARVLRGGGRLCAADWGAPRGAIANVGARVLSAVDGAAGLGDHLDGRLTDCLEDGGFGTVRVVQRVGTVWGTLDVLTAQPRATRPAS
ncbi:MAG: hypothetical protein QOJ12_3041 [Thermoleophilales bacterium]|nr:hypothetical protein [Thermoleophilales bacterium]